MLREDYVEEMIVTELKKLACPSPEIGERLKPHLVILELSQKAARAKTPDNFQTFRESNPKRRCRIC